MAQAIVTMPSHVSAAGSPGSAFVTTNMRVKATTEKLYCGYVTVAGTKDDAIPAFATAFGMVQPVTSWYVLFARCDADGESAVDATYFSSSFDPTLKKLNDGR